MDWPDTTFQIECPLQRTRLGRVCASASRMDEPTPRILDGYRLIRFLGSGGFGEVWLCRSEAMGDFRAIKLIRSTRPDRLEREHESLVNYRAVAGLRSPHLVPIEHINWYGGGLCYVMPLADGRGGDGPEDPGWQPLGLDLLVEARREAQEWFASREIVDLIRPVLLALQTLSEAKLVHRDVKPANILLFEGRPRLGDVSLLGEDAAAITRRGTPGYAPPSWYEGGHPDMYSVGATLYTLLTGNSPDKMGRVAFLWPPQGEDSLSEAEREEWRRLHAVVRRAADERVSERYVDFAAMLAAVEGREEEFAGIPGLSPRQKRLLAGAIPAAAAAVLIAGWGGKQEGATPAPAPAPTALSELTPDEVKDCLELMATDLEQGLFDEVVEFIDELFALHPRTMEHPQFSLDRATALKGLGRIDEAKEELRRAVHVHPNIAWMPPRIGLWESMGEIGEAETSQTRILEACGPNTMALLFRAEVRAKRGNYVGVEADRQAALPLNSYAPSEQRRLVDTLWSELEKKYPGYAEYRAGLADAGGGPGAEAEAAHDDEWVLAVMEVVADELAPEDAGSSGQANEGRGYLRATLVRYFESRGHFRALTLLDRRTAADSPGVRPLVTKTYLLSLYRALLLKRLGRDEEADRELAGARRDHLGPRQAAACAAMLDALGRQAEAEELLTGMMEDLLSKDGEPALPDRVSLHALRAKIRAIREDYPGVRDDYEAALALVEASVARRTGDGPGEDRVDLRAWVEQVRENARKKFPAYAAYEESLSAGSAGASSKARE